MQDWEGFSRRSLERCQPGPADLVRSLSDIIIPFDRASLKVQASTSNTFASTALLPANPC